MIRFHTAIGLCLLCCGSPPAPADEPPKPAADASGAPPARLVTRWAKDVAPDNVHAEYPRPQLVRSRWLNLNGLWDYAIRERAAATKLSQFDGKILVPFPVESTLSGVRRFVGPDQALVYRRTFKLPAEWQGQRVLLHFGAVDWEAQVFVDGREAGLHRGGYDSFSLDITDVLRGSRTDDDIEHELAVVVWDPSDAGTQPRGKQVLRPHGIWYTPVTGIWQTVWLEPVPESRITALQIDPIFQEQVVVVRVVDDPALLASRPRAGEPSTDDVQRVLRVTGHDGKWTAHGPANKPLVLETPGCKPWSPASPQLYELTVELLEGRRVIDRVQSYFGMRKVELGTDLNGTTRILFNGQPFFMFGPLDQGWWPDGLYTAPTDEALRYDLEMTKQFGFNTVRKHVKVEPARWYYHCDRLGLMVWQDMPSGDANARWPLDGTENRRSQSADAQYGRELKAMLNARRNDTCIVAWVPFNEGWGQYDTLRWTKFIKTLDPSRLVISASGGNDFGAGDARDIHFYPQPEAPPAETHRAAVLGEYGGLGLPLPGHTWQDEKNWGYRQFRSREDLQATYLKYVANLRPFVESRLSAAIYTQTTDVEIETNGLMTYDRAVAKFDPRTLAGVHRTLYGPLRKLSDAEIALASAIAYWRFEDGKPGEPVPHDPQQREAAAARDVSGHRNHLYAFSDRNAPRTTTDVPAAQVPALGLVNRGALDDTQPGPGGTRDLYTDPGRSRTHMDSINSFPFTAWTVEASFKLAVVGRAQTIVGKDGRPTSHSAAPLQLLVRDDDRLACVAIDRSGQVRTVASLQPLRIGQWYHAAAVADGQTLRLYVKSTGDYELLEESPFHEGLILHDGTWTVGRGFHGGQLGRDAQATIDEVRVSTRALPVEWLLWNSPVR